MEANQLTAEDLAAIRAYAEGSADYLRNSHKDDSGEITGDLDPNDAESLLDFFETDIPRLLATVEALRIENAKLKDELVTLNHDFDARLAQFRALAKRASAFAVGIAPDNLGSAVRAILDELAALHKEAADG